MNSEFMAYSVQKLRNHSLIETAMRNSSHMYKDSLFPHPSWNSLSLCEGYPGILLLFSFLEEQELIQEGIAHTYVLRIKEILEKDGIADLSLFSGLTGICFAIHHASRQGTRYSRLLYKLHCVLAERIKFVYLDPLSKNRSNHSYTSSFLYDSVQGLCGIGRYLLEHVDNPFLLDRLKEITNALIAMTLPIHVDGVSVPGWCLSPQDPLNVRGKEELHGNFNIGLAHGAPGILSFLAMVSLRGVIVDGLKEALERLSSWICAKSLIIDGMIRWPSSISWEEEVGSCPQKKDLARDAWCYGVPGVARSLFLAGRALRMSSLRDFAMTAFRSIFLRSPISWNLPGPSLCHGIAGLLLITYQMAQEEEGSDLLIQVNYLQEMLDVFYQKEHLFGFQDVEPSKKGGYVQIDNPGFLEGASGILLTLYYLELERESSTSILSLQASSAMQPEGSKTPVPNSVSMPWHLPLLI